MSESLKPRLDVAVAAAWEAGKATLRHFQTPLAVERKADQSPVTAADRESEAILHARLSRAFPADGFLGEEGGERPGSSGYRWIVDPLDGTKSFVQGSPLYGVLVGLEDPRGETVLGAVYLPALDELVTAARGEGCFWNGRRAAVSAVTALKESCVLYTSLKAFEETGRMDVLRACLQRARLVRGWGDCYGHVLVATGRAEAIIEPVLNVWDCAALLPILEEAGGTFTDWDGRRTVHGKSGISTNGKVTAELRALLDGGRRPG